MQNYNVRRMKMRKLFVHCSWIMMVYVAMLTPVWAGNNCRDLAGTWYAYNPGINRQGEAKIIQQNGTISTFNEVGFRADGIFIDPDTIQVDIGGGQMLLGDIVEKGKRINWRNKTYWIKR